MTSLKTARRAAFAILAACAAQLALRAGTTLWRKIEIWRVLHGLEPLVAPDADAGAAPSFATETISFSVVSSGVLLALSLLGVALVERVLADLRVPERHRTAPPRGATSLAIALGAVLFAATAGSVAGSVAFAAAVRPDGVPGGAWLAHAQFALSSLETLASMFALAALPFCLLRLAGRRFAAPPAGSPADAALRRAEAWLSIALAGGAAALVGDVAWTALEALPRPFVGFPGQLRAAALAGSLAQPVLALSVLAAARDLLRRLLAAGELPSAPGGRIVPLVAVAGLSALAAAFFLPADLAAVRGGLLGTEMRALHDVRLAAMAAFYAQFVFCAALLRRLPVPPGAPPAPPPPAFAGPARACIGLALAVAALACPLLDAHATAAAALAAAVWLGATARGGRFVAIRIALAAVALGAAVLLAGRLFSRLVLSDGPMAPRAYTEPARIGWNDLFVSVRISADGTPVRNRHEWSHWTEDECALLAEWAADMEGCPAPGLPRFPGEPLAMVGGDPLHRAGCDAIVHAAFYPDLVTFLNGDRFFAREPTPLDLRVLVALVRQVETDPATAESAEVEPHAESAEGAEIDFHAESAEGAEDESHAEGATPDWTEYFMAMDAFVEQDCVNDTNVWSEAFFTDFDAFRDALLAALRNRDGEAFAGLVDERHRAGIRGPDGRCDVFDKAYFRRLEPVGRSDVLLRRIGPDDRNRLLAAMPDETNRVGRMFVCIVSRPGGNGPALSLPVLYDRGSFRIASPRGWIRFGEAVPDIVPPGTVFEDGSRVAKADAYPVWIPRFRSPAADALSEALSEALRGDPPPDFTFRWHPLARERSTAANAGLAAFRDALAGRELRVRFNAWTPETDPLAGSGLGSSALAEQIGSLQLDAGGFASGSDRRDEQRRRRANRSGNWPGMFPSALEDGLWLEGDVAVVNGGRETPFLLFTAVERPDGCRLLGMQPMDDLLADVSAATATPTVERVARAFLDSLATNATLSRIEAESADFYVPVRPNLRIALDLERLPATRSSKDKSHAESAEGAETKSHAESAEFAE